MKDFPIRLSFVYAFLSIFSICICNERAFSIPLTDDWNEYQSLVLEEKQKFPGWCPNEKAKRIMNLILNNNSDICVEIGVYGGSSFFPLASAVAFKKQGIAYAIDPWKNDPCLEGYDEEMDKKMFNYWGKIDLEKVKNKFIDNMHRNGLDSNYVLMQSSSAEALSFFEDKSIDFIHIDGNHSEQASVYDVEHWIVKVKNGGIVCFDDAWWESTQKAINILLQECDLMKNESSEKKQYIFLRKR